YLTVPFARVLAQTPEARFLHRLVLRGAEITFRGGAFSFPSLHALCAWPGLANLRVLHLHPEVGWDDPVPVDALVVGASRLEELSLREVFIDVPTLLRVKGFPRLRTLELDHCGFLEAGDVERLLRSPSLAELTTL